MQSFMSTKLARALGAAVVLFIFSLFIFETSPTSVSSLSSSVTSKVTGVSKDAGSKSEVSLDPLSCTKSYDGKKPITQYAVVIDAGSSGSRVHVYKFNNCLATPRLLGEEFKMMQPGLSSFENDPEAAAKSLDELLAVAVEHVPKDVQGCTPIVVKATAGLRMIGVEAADKILAAVRTRLETQYPFAVVPGNGISIMDGSDEGVYAWVTANYLLGNIGSAEKTPTAAVFDLGGGSTQIVFEPHFSSPDKKLAPGDHKFDLDFGGRQFSLYQQSHLKYGLNVARGLIDALVVSNYLKSHEITESTQIVNPCMPPGSQLLNHEVKVEKSSDEGTTPSVKTYTVDFIGPKEHSEVQCRGLAEIILNKQKKCELEPCSFNGVHQPSIVDSFLRESDIFIFSYFYDLTYPLGMPSSFTIDELKDLTSKVCRGKEAHDSFAAIDGAVEELNKNPQWCQELNFIVALLHTGYDIPGHREVKIAKKIKDNELGWCLGASLPLLDKETAGWTCRA
ncbi:Gda1p [Sugiyamaella lignohabitans]|uniref:guanosine-diphosphatase n=1 Tax=Sugiyamaella lignohabitans TaxID=796027 RepID=A0A167DQD7_9ASCO|nr:Gda1p [Sugiyamaella lignohabitans]ANB13165.1 Gda1p [Sugiyamaella lignohabitans]